MRPPPPPSTIASPEETRAILRPGAPLNALTGVRFVAAFGVLLCHFAPLVFPWGPSFLVRTAQGMYNMVGLFFMLSGFVLAHSYGDRFTTGRVKAGAFLRARLARIYPTYLFSLLIALPILYVTYAERSSTKVATLAAVKLPLLQTWIFWDPFLTEAWNGPTWSISTELFFYLSFPLLAVPLLKLGLRGSTTLFALVASLSLASSLWYDLIYVVGTEHPAGWMHGLMFHSPFVRLADFVLGILLYRMTVLAVRSGLRLSTTIRRIGWGFVLVGSLLLWSSDLYMAKSQGLTTFLFAPTLALLALGEGSVTKILSSSILVRLGEESYALYLVHIPVSEFVLRGFARVGTFAQGDPTMRLLCGATIVTISILLAHLTHRWIEVPGRHWLRGRSPSV